MATKKRSTKKKGAGGGSRRSAAKPPTDIVLLGELEEAISRLSDSPRFDFLKNLIVAEFTESRKSSPLGGVTFGDLSNRFHSTRSLGDEIAKLEPADHSRLLKTIAELSGAEPSEAPPSLTPPPPPRPAHHDSPRLSSVEAERRLTDAITTLKSSPNFQLMKLSRLGDFWEEGWPRAPFEEALTLQQIAEMKVGVMLEKRSFSGAKILNFIRALERAVGGAFHPLHTPESASVPPLAAAAPAAHPETRAFLSPAGTKLPAHAAATLRYLENLAAQSGGEKHPLGLLLAQLPTLLTAPETAVTWFRQESDNDVVASLMHLPPLETAELCDSAYAKIAQLFRQMAPSESRSWLMALQSPAISLEELLSPFPPTALPSEATVGLARIVLSALGAEHPRVFGRRLERYYTKAIGAFELIIERLIGSFPRAEDQVIKEIETLLPFVDPAEVRPILLAHAHFNERDRVWSKR